jgi:hypothetical protein
MQRLKQRVMELVKDQVRLTKDAETRQRREEALRRTLDPSFSVNAPRTR